MKKTTIQFGKGKHMPVVIPEEMRLAAQRDSESLGFVSFSGYIRWLIMDRLQKSKK